ncbi:transposase family protein [Amycolatopsis taiwanensis]|uniref:transposase family protein n=1 Tax=Amycolatopsis taiwanensis TaxID=342230 RepID=UPI003D7F7983
MPAGCPGRGVVSARVHSRYRRRLSDTAIGGREVLIRPQVRRLFCDNTACGRRRFAEQVPDPGGSAMPVVRPCCSGCSARSGRPWAGALGLS